MDSKFSQGQMGFARFLEQAQDFVGNDVQHFFRIRGGNCGGYYITVTIHREAAGGEPLKGGARLGE
jgi:hypothetical protein